MRDGIIAPDDTRVAALHPLQIMATGVSWVDYTVAGRVRRMVRGGDVVL